jgi:hypothetical protein
MSVATCSASSSTGGAGKLVGVRHELRDAPLGLLGIELLFVEEFAARGLLVLFSVVFGDGPRRGVGHAPPFPGSSRQY